MLLANQPNHSSGAGPLAVALLWSLMTFSGCSSKTEHAERPSNDPQADDASAASIEAVQTVPPTAPVPSIAPEHAVAAEPPRSDAPFASPSFRSSQPARPSAPMALRHEPEPTGGSIERATTAPQSVYSAGEAPRMAAESRSQLFRLPAGAERDGAAGYATVQVFYATDRQSSSVPLSSYAVSGQKPAFMVLCGTSFLLALCGLISLVQGRSRTGTAVMAASCMTGCLAAACVAMGEANIEKHGVMYTSDRGTSVRGVCEVTVPDSHQRGLVERPSLLRFEVREDQTKHIVLTSATELAKSDFHQRLSDTIARSPEGDLLVFIHGYNVDFESAVQRTAQIAVDLPFEGVPVCYSWPSQASLMGYTVDENNSEWTIAHLKQFLMELVKESGATSINVVAHSMGNRPMTAAMQQIRWELESDAPAPFDRIVLAAPDIDADRFRRDLAPNLLSVAKQVTLYASSDDQALIASKQVHGYPRAGESGSQIVVVPGIETIDVTGIDLSLLGHSYYGDNESMLRDLYELVRQRLPAAQRAMLTARRAGEQIYWQLAQRDHLPLR